jgi:hypothetical protein
MPCQFEYRMFNKQGVLRPFEKLGTYFKGKINRSKTEIAGEEKR